MAPFEFPWERKARAGHEMPEGLSLLDQMAYTAMREVYRSYNRHAITRDAAAAEKRRVRRQYEEARKMWSFWEGLAHGQAERSIAIEAAVTACRKDPTPENALRLCDVLDGLKVSVDEKAD